MEMKGGSLHATENEMLDCSEFSHVLKALVSKICLENKYIGFNKRGEMKGIKANKQTFIHIKRHKNDTWYSCCVLSDEKS
jgi:hypothetical protein